MSRVLVILNPAAGRGRAARLWPQAAHALAAQGVAFELATTRTPREATALAEAAAGEDATVVAAGGDGTVHEVANGLLRAGAGTLGVLPLGSGDDFAKMIPPETRVGGRPFGWEAAVAKIARGETRRFDAGRIETDAGGAQRVHYFANGMDVGFGAQGAAHAATMPRWLKGQAAYLGALARTLVHYPRLRLRIAADGAPPEPVEATIVAVMNGRCFGGSFWVCPQACADDGLLDLMTVDALGRGAILGLVPKVMRGAHLADPRVRTRRVREVTIDSEAPIAVEADGELPFGAARTLRLSVLPAALRAIV